MRNFKRFGIAGIALLASLICLPFALSTSAMADTYTNSHAIRVAAVSTHDVTLGWSAVGATVKDEVIVYDASTLQLAVHIGSEAGHSTGRTVDFGSSWQGHIMAAKVAYVVNGHNTGWSLPVEFFVTVSAGGAGSAGPAGPKGDTGAQGPSGVVASALSTLTDATSLVNTGGSFTANKTLVGHVSLKAGTYLVTLNAKAAWASGTGEFPQFFVYKGVALADFSNDLFNVGNGALAQDNASIDSYYSGTGQVTLTEDGDLDIYAFGYNANHGAGTFSLENLTVTATQLQLAS
jgi:hypothetical protein